MLLTLLYAVEGGEARLLM